MMGLTGTTEQRLTAALREPRSASVTLDQLGFRGKVVSDDLRALAWTEWFLRPSFSRVKEAAAWEITFLRDDELFAELSRTPEERRQRVQSWVTHAAESERCWEAAQAPFRLLYDGELDTFCAVAPQERKILVVARANNPRAQGVLMRSLRELASLRHQRHGAVILHAAAIEQHGQATLILAPKRGGKTTFLIAALLGGARLIANDRVALYRRPEGIYAAGIPTIVSLRPGTLELFPQLQAELSERRLHFWRRPRDPVHTGEHSIAPLQLCRLTGAGVVPEARVSRLLCLRPGNGDPKRLEDCQTLGQLRQQVFDYTDAQRHFFVSLCPLEEARFREAAERMLRELCCQAESWEYPREGNGAGR